MEGNGRKRKETARIQHMGRSRGNQTRRQIKMERTRPWPHSPRGDRELSQSKSNVLPVANFVQTQIGN